MDQYYDSYGTPLKFHKFLKYFGIPFGCLSSLLQVMGLSVMESANPLVTVELICGVILLTVQAVTIYGFYTWKPCGFYGILVNYWLSVGYALLVVVLAFSLNPLVAGSAIGSLLGSAIAAVLATIYYLKRRPLFFEKMRTVYFQNLFEEKQNSSPNVPEDKSGGDPLVCRVCGGKLNLGRTVCMKCGTAIPVVEEPTTPPAANPTVAVSRSFCPHCGNQLLGSGSFCNQCGAKIQ